MEKIEINCIIFDLDGVIIDSSKDLINAVRHTMDKYCKREITDESIISYLGNGQRDLIKKSFGTVDDNILEDGLIYYRDYYYNNCTNESVLFKNVEYILNIFKDKSLNILTNKPEGPAKKILEHFGIMQYFDIIAGPETSLKMKPEPDGINIILDKLEIDKQKAIMVGDSDTDIVAGKRAKVYTCGIKGGFGNIDDLSKQNPDFIIDNIIELKNIIKNS